MKKPLLVTFGILIIILVLGFWVYLMFFNTNETGADIFSDFGFNIAPQQDNPIIAEPTIDEMDIFVDVSGEPLRQLTLRPVAGFMAITSSPSSFVRYAENGTGHIYEIDLNSGEEKRISGTTIPRVTEAYFSEDGEYVALVSESGYVRETFFGKIEISETSGLINGRSLPINAKNITVTGEIIQYSLATSNGTDLYSYNDATQEQRIINSIQLRDVYVESVGAKTYVLPKPSKLLEGSLYEIITNNLVSVTKSGFSFSGHTTDNHYVYTEPTGEILLGQAKDKTNGFLVDFAVAPLPEKCTSRGNTLWCAAPIGGVDVDYIENWYKGTENSQDVIWETNLNTGASILKIDLFETTNRTVDAGNLEEEGNQLYFVNKVDGTLWQYDLNAS